jgi:hypothetical protein
MWQLMAKIRSALVAAALVVSALVVPAATAYAEDGCSPYNGVACVSVPDEVEAGSVISISVRAFQPNETVTVTLHSDPVHLGSFVVDSAGAGSTAVTIPASVAVGPHTISVTGNESGRTASAGISITAPVDTNTDDEDSDDGDSDSDDEGDDDDDDGTGNPTANTGVPRQDPLGAAIPWAAGALLLAGLGIAGYRRVHAR